MAPPATSVATAIDVDGDSDATLSSDSDVDMDGNKRLAPDAQVTATPSSPPPPTTTMTTTTATTTNRPTATFSDSMAAARGSLLTTASMGSSSSSPSSTGSLTHAVAAVSLANGKKRRLSSPPPARSFNEGKPRASLDFRLGAMPKRVDRSMKFIDEDEDGDEEDELEETKSDVAETKNGINHDPLRGVSSAQHVSAIVGAMSRVESMRTWICGRWFGKCVLEFHMVYVKFTIYSLPTSSGSVKSEYTGSMQSRQLERFSLSRGPAPYFAILEFSRRCDVEPDFVHFYDLIFSRVTEKEGPSIVPDIYGMVLFFDDDLELARCQSLGDISKILRGLLEKSIPATEVTQVRALKLEQEPFVSTQRSSTSVFSMITDKVKGTIDTISHLFSPDRSPQKLRQSKISIDTTDMSDQESSAMSTRFRTSTRRKSLLQSSRDAEVVVQLSGETDPNPGSIAAPENGSDRRSTRGVVQLVQQHHRKETQRLSAERKAKLLLSYPFEDSSRVGQITITYGDIDRLKPGEFLNDSIIDFYLRYLWRHVEPWQQTFVHFFSSHFFTQLCGGKLSGAVSLSEDRLRRVARWTQKEDLFEKRFIFVPINDSCHWSIAVLCNPGSAIITKRRKLGKKKGNLDDTVILLDSTDDTVIVDTTVDASESEDEERQRSKRTQNPPCILFLDSLRCHQKKKICTLLKSYIEYEFNSRHGSQAQNAPSGSDPTTVTSFDVDSITIIEPEIPLQSNSSDCGVFLLMYTAQILQRFPAGLSQDDVASKLSSSMSKQMFDDGHVYEFRDYLHQLIFMLQKLDRRGSSELAIKTEGLEFFAIES